VKVKISYRLVSSACMFYTSR